MTAHDALPIQSASNESNVQALIMVRTHRYLHIASDVQVVTEASIHIRGHILRIPCQIETP